MESFYISLLIASCAVTSALLVLLYVTRRYMFMKPSVVFVTLFTIFIHIPVVVYYNQAIGSLDVTRFGVVIMVSAFPLLVLVIGFFFHNGCARHIFVNLDHYTPHNTATVFAMLTASVVCAWIYFAYVPVRATGLYSIFAEGEELTNRFAREESMKMLPALPRYAFTIGSVVFSNYALILITSFAHQTSQSKGIARALPNWVLAALLLVACTTFASVSGARSPGAIPSLMFATFLILRKRLRLRASRDIPLLFVALAVPTTLQYLRSDTGTLWNAAVTVADRVFWIGIDSGMANVRSVENEGFWGLAAIPQLATVAGLEYINVPNEVAKIEYPHSPIQTGLANCCFVLSYYSYFGLMALPLCVGLMLFLDALVIIVAKYVHPSLFCITMTGLLLPLLYLTSVDFQQIFITRGCLLWVLISVALSVFARPWFKLNKFWQRQPQHLKTAEPLIRGTCQQ